MHFCSVGLILVFVCFYTHFLLKNTHTHTLSYEEMSLFGGLFGFLNDFKGFLFFSYFHGCDFRNNRAQINVYICSFPVSFLTVFIFWEQIVLQDFDGASGEE